MRKYKCDCCGSIFKYPDHLKISTGVYAPDGIEEVRTIAACPYCGDPEIRSVYICELCGEEEVDTREEFCEECLNEIERELERLAKFYRADKDTMLDAVNEIVMRN